jgi:tRNA-2-methylthio-N6-dimethylallyladenosine synthase
MANESVTEQTVFIKTYGCQMNGYDSAQMVDVLAGHGFRQVYAPELADLVVLNTCHVREKAAEKVYSELGKLRRIKQDRLARGKQAILAVAGCVAQAEGAEILSRAPAVDLVVGPQSGHRLAELLERAKSGERPIATEFEIADKFAASRVGRANAGRVRSAFLTIQEGCDKFCSFCVVPYTRGSEVSRPAAAILDEADRLLDSGACEITLLGQNVNAWHGTGPNGSAWRLGDLIETLALRPHLRRIRYTTSHPVDMDRSLVEAHRHQPKLMPYLHLPVQAGSDRVLKAMNRHHTRAQYQARIAEIREARPDIAISGDFIVGFPGETEADFEETLDLVRRVEYASAFSFKYSPRPGTPAAQMRDQVPENEKLRRLHRLQALIGEQVHRFNRNCVGRELEVLVEKPGRRAGQLAGRSPYLQTVLMEQGAAGIGDLVTVRIVAAGPNSLHAEPAG